MAGYNRPIHGRQRNNDVDVTKCHIRCVLLLLLLSGLFPAWALAAPDQGAAVREADMSTCGDPFTNMIGPFDYTNPIDRTKPRGIGLIEHYHFDSGVENLTKGLSDVNVMADLDYTLRAIPNHHRALNSVARYELEFGGIPKRWHSADCWFTRAITFRPTDGVVWMLYGNFKAKQKKWDEALEKYQRAKELMPNNIEVDYNMGLLYVHTQNYEKAVEHARVAYARNYPLQGLKKMLARHGYSLDD